MPNVDRCRSAASRLRTEKEKDDVTITCEIYTVRRTVHPANGDSNRPVATCASFVTAAIVPLCLSLLLGACGDDSSSHPTSGTPAELRDYPYCEVIPDTVSGDTCD